MRAKGFQPRADVPMTTETYRRLALELRMAGEALINYPTPDTYNQVSKMFAALVKCGMVGEAMDLANATLNRVCDRFVETLQVTVDKDEAEYIRLAIASVDDRLPRVPVNRLRQAMTEVEVFCASIGA